MSFRAISILFVLLLAFCAPAQAAIVFVGSATGSNTALPTNGTAGALTVNRPVVAKPGMAMIVSVAARPSQMTWTVPAGWTELSVAAEQFGGGVSTLPGGMTMRTYWKIVDVTEPNSYTWTMANVIGAGASGGGSAVAGMLVYSGIDTSGATPLDGTPTSRLNASGTIHRTNPVTTLTANAQVVSMISFLSSRTFAYSGTLCGTVERLDVAAPPPNNAIGSTLQMGDFNQAVPGASCAPQATASGDADTGVGHLLALKPSLRDLTLNVVRSGALIPGSSASYTLTASNTPGSLSEPGPLTIISTLPAQLSFVSASGSGWVCGVAGQVVTCQKTGALAGGASATPLVINVNVAAGASGVKTFTSTLSGVGGDGNLVNNTAVDNFVIPTPAFAEYRMDETAWGTILDASGNGRNASVLGTATPVPNMPASPGAAITGSPGTCGAGSIPTGTGANGVNTAIDVNSIGNTGSIAFWYASKEAWVGNNRILFDASNDRSGSGDGAAGDKHFFLVKDSGGRLVFALEDTADVDSTATSPSYNFAANTWHHIAVTWDLAADSVAIYLDGNTAPVASSAVNVNGVLGDLATLYLGARRMANVQSTPAGYTNNTANAYIDEVRLYNSALHPLEIADIVARTHSCGGVSIAAPGAINEGNSGTSVLNFTVSLDAAKGSPITVNYATSDGTATGGPACGPGVDYVVSSGTLTIPAGTVTGTVPVTICGDTDYEPNETLTMTLSNPVGVLAGSPMSAIGAVNNDDLQPTINVTATAYANEGDAGATNMSFTVNLSASSYEDVSFDYSTTGGSATAGTDYTAANNVTVTIPAGQISATFNIAVLGDTEPEVDETITVTLTNPANGALGTAIATGTILDDDLVAEYPMDANWNDSSGNDHNATASQATIGNGAPGPAYSSGGLATCGYGSFGAATTPTRPYLSLPAAVPPGSSFTVATWIYTTDASKIGQRIVARDDSNDGWGFSVSDEVAGTLRMFNRGISLSGASGGTIMSGGVALDTPVVISSNTWYYVAAAVDLINSTVALYVYAADGSVLANATANFSGSWNAGSGSTTVGGEGAASAENGLNFNGYLDELRFFRGALNSTKIASFRAQVRTCVVIDHLRIEHDGEGLTCATEPVTVRACVDSNCTAEYPGAVTATLAPTGWVGGEIIAFSGGSVTVQLSHTTAGTVTLAADKSSASPSPQQATRCFNGASETCDLSFVDTGFIFSQTGAAPFNQLLPNQIAGTGSANIYLVGVRTDTPTQSCMAALAGTNSVDFGYECLDPATCYSANLMSINGGTATTVARNNSSSVTSYLPVTMTFDANGAALFTLAYSDVGEIRLHARKTVNGAILNGSGGGAAANGGFVVKPAGFVLSDIKQTATPNLPNPAAADATGDKFVKAGESFSATVTAVTSTGTTAYSYGRESVAEGVKLTSALKAGLGLTHNPTLINDSAFGPFTDGEATGTTFAWNEVGVISLTPSVGDGDYLGAGDATGTISGDVGRFYAAKFALSSGSTLTNRSSVCPIGATGAGCPATFSYVGEPMSAAFTLTAQAMGGSTLENYRQVAIVANNFAKLDPMGAVVAGTGGPLGLGAVNDVAASRTPFLPCAATPVVPCLQPVTATAGQFAAGIASVTVPLAIERAAAPVSPYSALKIAIAPQDSDGAALGSFDLDTVNATAGTNNHAQVGAAVEARYGRLRLLNAYGSERLPARVEYRTEYWIDGRWTINTLDSTTSLVAGNLSTGGLVVSSVGGLANGVGTIVFGQAAAGRYDIAVNLNAAGGDTSCNAVHGGSGAMLPWLKGFWSTACNGTAAWQQDPSARIRLGSAKAPYIYLRERY